MSTFPPAGGYPPLPPYGGPPAYPHGQPAALPPPRTSGTAVTGFVLSLLLCIPFASGLGGLIFGLVGLSATGKPNVRGRGLAVAAVVIGAVGLLGWAVISITVVPNFMAGARAGFASTTTGPAFARALAAGNVSAAIPLCAAGTPSADLQKTSDELQAFGSGPTVAVSGLTFDPPGQLAKSSTNLVLTYPAGTKVLHVTFQQQADGSIRISHWTLR